MRLGLRCLARSINARRLPSRWVSSIERSICSCVTLKPLFDQEARQRVLQKGGGLHSWHPGQELSQFGLGTFVFQEG